MFDNRPILKETKYGQQIYDESSIALFLEDLGKSLHSSSIVSSKIYLHKVKISQSKLRDAGFQICRDIKKADYIIITDYCNATLRHSYGGPNTKAIDYRLGFDEFLDTFDSSFKFVRNSDLYSHLYKYTGDLELYSSITELLESNNKDNTRIAMEFMSNADWNLNEIYLRQIFNNYWSRMKYQPYKTSVSFKGFLDSLDFDYASVRLYKASQYRILCKTEEHHDFVYGLFIDEFKKDLQKLISSNKIQIDKLEYSIDKSTLMLDDE